ncbi:leucine rich repeat protein [Pelomyxa schiedti]|nr:leucine rich repeat protein [Pelomyxa schiedti]
MRAALGSSRASASPTQTKLNGRVVSLSVSLHTIKPTLPQQKQRNVYIVRVWSASSSVILFKRFRDFSSLYEIVQRKFRHAKIPHLPPRHIMGLTDMDAFEAKRVHQLESFLKTIALLPNCFNIPEVKGWLQEHSPRSKPKVSDGNNQVGMQLISKCSEPTLDLSGVKFNFDQTHFSEIQNLVFLTNLNLSFNLMPLFPDLTSLINLETLDVSFNRLTSLEGIGELRSLKHLFVSSNRLTQISEEIGNLSNLELLHCFNNEISTINAALGRLQNLKDLDVSGNPLTELPNEIGHCTALESLNASDCHLSELPPSITNLKRLCVLNVSDNFLCFLPYDIGHLTRLCSLSVADNRLGELPPSLCLCKLTVQFGGNGLILFGNNLPSEFMHSYSLGVEKLFNTLKGKLSTQPLPPPPQPPPLPVIAKPASPPPQTPPSPPPSFSPQLPPQPQQVTITKAQAPNEFTPLAENLNSIVNTLLQWVLCVDSVLLTNLKFQKILAVGYTVSNILECVQKALRIVPCQATYLPPDTFRQMVHEVLLCESEATALASPKSNSNTTSNTSAAPNSPTSMPPTGNSNNSNSNSNTSSPTSPHLSKLSSVVQSNAASLRTALTSLSSFFSDVQSLPAHTLIELNNTLSPSIILVASWLSVQSLT